MDWIDEINKMEKAHGLMMFVRGRDDAEFMLGREMTEDEWNTLISSYEWRKAGESEIINDLINDQIADALRECGIE